MARRFLKVVASFGKAIAALQRAGKINEQGAIAFYNGVGAALKTQMQIDWRSEVSPYGVRWAPLKPSTLARRRRKGRGSKILQDTGQALLSIAYVVRPKSVTMVIGKTYMAIHQTGDPARRIPIRKTLPDPGKPLPNSWRTIVLKEAEDMLRSYGFS